MRLADIYNIPDSNFEDWQQALDTHSAQVLGSLQPIQYEWMETFNVLPAPACDLEISSFTPVGSFTDRIRKSNAPQSQIRKAA